ncbi:sugar ABC transporter substrate-binding protein [Lachnospiraceae bacterium 54-53]
MRKKRLALGLCAALAAGLLAGCGGGTAPAPESTQAASQGTEGTKEDVTITYISSTILESPEGDFEKKCIEEFNALDNGITVEVEGIGANDLMKKYITLATSNAMPDFFLANLLDTGTIVDMGLAAEATPIFGEDYIKGFEGASLASASADGTAYGIPWFGGASGVLYRKDIFDEKGVKVPETWEDLVEASKALTGDGNYGITLVGTNNASGAGRFQYVLRNFGVDEFVQDAQGKWTTDIGSQKYIDALRAYTDLEVTYKAVPPGVIETDYPTAVNLFSSGKAAMLITGSNAIGAITSQVPELKGKLGSFPVPAVERSVSTPGGFGYFISPGKHEKESAEFIKFMLEKDREIEFSVMTGRLPTRIEALEDPAIKTMPELEGFLKARQTVYETPAVSGYSEINDVHGEAYQSVFTGESTVEEAAERARERAEKICESANEG